MLYDFVVKRSTDNGVIYYFFILEIYFTTYSVLVGPHVSYMKISH